MKIYHFDPYILFWAIATNIPQRLKTGFVVQGHIYSYSYQTTSIHPELFTDVRLFVLWHLD